LAKKKKAAKPQREYTRRQLSQLQRQRRRQRILFYGGIFIIAAVVVIVLVGWYMGEYRPMHQTVIAVDDAEFDASYYIDALRFVGRDQPVEYLQSLADPLIQQIEQGELIRQAALKLGISISDDEVKQQLESAEMVVNDASVDLIRAELLRNRIYSDYLDPKLPASDEQVHIMAMLVESENQAEEVRARLQNSENFTSLAEEFAQNYYSKEINQGDFGWHPRSILEEQLGSSVAVDYAFSSEPGTLSQPLEDEEAYKQLGYWLIKVLERQFEDEAVVQAVLLCDEEEAEEIKARLEAGDDLETIASEYSQYSESKDQGGELGAVSIGDISDAFDAYVFNPDLEIGVWSEPIRDDVYWTQGGYWLIKVVDRDDDRELSVEDRDYLLGKEYDDWLSNLWLENAAGINHTYLTPEVKQWVIEEASKA
jgi:parvulin-like peptidyl-prolyl isomerase